VLDNGDDPEKRDNEIGPATQHSNVFSPVVELYKNY